MDGDPLNDIGFVDNILHWTCPQNVQPNLDTDRKPRARRPTRKALNPLFWNEFDDVKHSDYTAHLLILKQTRDYAFAVEDAILLLKNTTTNLLSGVNAWRGSKFPKLPTPNDLTEYGSKVLCMSESIRELQKEDTLALWTTGSRDLILRLLVSLSKVSVKLRRKLERIKGTLGDRIRNLRFTVMKCECEVNHVENLVPLDIYNEWTKEDARWLSKHNTAHVFEEPTKSENPETSIETLTKTILQTLPCSKIMYPFKSNLFATPSEESLDSIVPSPSVKKYYGVWKDIQILHKDSFDQEADSVYEGSLSSLRRVSPNSSSMSLCQEENDNRVTKISRRHLQIIASNVTLPNLPTTSCIYDHREFLLKENSSTSQNKHKPMNSIDALLTTYHSGSEGQCEQNLVKENICITSGGEVNEQYGRTSIHMRTNPPPNQILPFLMSQESKQHEVESDPDKVSLEVYEICTMLKPVVRFNDDSNLNQDQPQLLCCQLNKSIFENDSSDVINTCPGAATPFNNSGSCENFLAINTNSQDDNKTVSNGLQIVPTSQKQYAIVQDQMPHETVVFIKRALSTSMVREMSFIKCATEDLNKIVTLATETVREVESCWYDPPLHMMRSKNKKLKELYQLLDFIVETAKLTDNPAFASRLYPEDKHEIISVLDPIFRELTTCYVALCEFCKVVKMDVAYLKELVSCFPQGNIVIKDYVSDPALDKDLEDVEQSTDIEIDVEELFA